MDDEGRQESKMNKAKLKLIRSEKEHGLALKAIEDLWDAKPGSEAHDSLEVLALLVEDYERRTFPIDEPAPVAATPMEALIPRRAPGR
jgi:antitoxin component HigA of HigAB toxin-antitoxin module